MEMAIDRLAYIFDAINCRPDGRHLTLTQITSCYLAMFGDYAKALQHEGTSFEAWLSFKGNWQHIWRYVSSADAVDSAARADGSTDKLNIPDGISSMLKTNTALMKGMQSSFERKLSHLQAEVQKTRGGGKPNKGAGKNKDKKRNYLSQDGPGALGGGGNPNVARMEAAQMRNSSSEGE